MSKLIICFLLFVFGALDYVSATDVRIQMLDAQIANLESERVDKLAKLKKCEKKTKGFKTAGLSTLALTGVGIYANIKLSEKLKNTPSGGGKAGVASDIRSEEKKASDECVMFCELDPAEAAGIGCEC